MPPNLPSELKLDDHLYEEDIGDQSPYLPLPSSTSSHASSTTLASSFLSSARNSPRLGQDSPLSGGDTAGTTPKKFRYGFAAPSTSSPSLSNFSGRPRKLSRSQTLPRGFQMDKAKLALRPLHKEIMALPLDTLEFEKLHRWIMGIAVVEFDLDDGPIVEGVYPPIPLHPTEAENIAFSGFPDSMQFDQGYQNYSFRIREQFVPSATENRPPTDDGFIYGFSHFAQRRDLTSKRGYQQRSVVILTRHQYPALFTALAATFGPLFDAHGTPMLEAACHNIATWSDPTPGGTIELGFLGSVLHVEIPTSLDTQQLSETSSFNEKYNPRLHILAGAAPFDPPPILLFEAALSNLWSIWECLVLCEPILVFGTSPVQTSQAIWWLRDLMRPIPLAGDIRPYFTMQDGDNAQLVNKLPPKAGLIIGVTNPFFEKSCSHWPHILSLGKRVVTSSMSTSRHSSPSIGTSAGPAPGWKTKTHKRYISKDRVLLKQLEDACLKGNEKTRMEASLALRRHFCSRTTHLITPLARYINSLIPSPNEVRRARKASAQNTYTTPPSYTPTMSEGLRLKPFNTANFFSSLKANGSILPFRSASKRVEFYERWLKSPAFGTWLAQQEQIVQTVLSDPATPSITGPPLA